MTEETDHRRAYVGAYVALLVLLGATVGAARVPLGDYNVVIALAIAAAKALIVVMIFMHARVAPRLIWLFAAIGLVWLALLGGGTVTDVLTRR